MYTKYHLVCIYYEILYGNVNILFFKVLYGLYCRVKYCSVQYKEH